ncbi:chromatin/chromatin-binding, or -regulatory protein [Lithospermum erythrorhizon]|uniref:Chromatin/chromatin-binding, or -regulatory protein n=1 Tax=Lithospermum erythrorhizon TaxID=34254 RepID=A0AAV3PIF0_LITER
MGSSDINDSDHGGSTTQTDVDVDADDIIDDVAVESSPFRESEKVLAFHCELLYEAKVQKVDLVMKEWRFFIHYLGWNKSWDEWVGVDRLRKYNDENMCIQKELNANKKQDVEKKFGRAILTKPKSSSAFRGKKRKNDLDPKEAVGPDVKQVNIHIPPTLRKQLIDDYESIMHLGKLVKLPRCPNVEDLLNKYLEYHTRKGGMMPDSVEEIVNGLRCYFDKALPALLLYKNERQQYQEATTNDKSPSFVYGAEHLLRLFVKLPELLYHANIEEATLAELRQHLQAFLKFLQKNQSAFFVSAYHSL